MHADKEKNAQEQRKQDGNCSNKIMYKNVLGRVC